MIFSTVLLNVKNKRKIASSEYWTKPIPRKVISKYLAKLETQAKVSERLRYQPIVLEKYKFFSRDCGDGIIIFVTDPDESNEDVTDKINRAASSLRSILVKHTKKYVKTHYDQIIYRFIKSRFVIALVGNIGVGKTSLLHLLMGKIPPETHVPTIAVNTEVIEEIRFAKNFG